MRSAGCWRWARIPRYVFNTGSLDVELAAHVSTTITSEQVNALGVGHRRRHRAAVPDGGAASGDDRARQPRAPRDDAAGGVVVRAADDLVLAESGCRHRRDGRQPAPHARAPSGADRAHALHHQRGRRQLRGAAGARLLPGRQFVGRHQGVFVPRHAGRQHRRAPAGTPYRRTRDARRLRRRRRLARRSRRSSRTAATSRRTSTIAPTPARRWSTC